MGGRTQQGSAGAVIFLIMALALAALVFGGSKLVTSNSAHPSGPVAPLVGAVDQARATADAANRASHLQDHLSGSATVADPANHSTSLP